MPCGGKSQALVHRGRSRECLQDAVATRADRKTKQPCPQNLLCDGRVLGLPRPARKTARTPSTCSGARGAKGLSFAFYFHFMNGTLSSHMQTVPASTGLRSNSLRRRQSVALEVLACLPLGWGLGCRNERQVNCSGKFKVDQGRRANATIFCTARREYRRKGACRPLARVRKGWGAVGARFAENHGPSQY